MCSGNIISYVCLGGVAYLIGAVPNGWWVARLKGIDIRTVGSGNIGATNVFRSVGRAWGIAVFILDFLKGFLPALLFPLLIELWTETAPPPWAALAFGGLAVIGHNWPVYLGFKGGKGVATSAGMLAGAAPAAMGIGVLVWIVLFAATRYVSLGSIGAAAAAGTAAWPLYLDQGLVRPVVLSLLAVTAVARHQANIRRLLNGTESKIGRKPESAGGESAS